jgi:hypothetical protein
MSGKLLWIHTARVEPPDAQGFLAEFPELQNRLGRIVLTGRQVQLYRDQWAGYRHIAIAWSAILHYIVFESREDYLSRLLVWRRVHAAPRA